MLAPYDQRTKQFSRKLDGTYEDIDVFISCANNITISYYGKSILEAYIPSLGRGHNIIKAIKFGIAINPFRVSEISHASWRLIVALKIVKNKTEKGNKSLGFELV